MQQLNEKTYNTTVPYSEQIEVNVGDATDENEVKKLVSFIEAGLKKDDDTSELKSDVSYEGDTIVINLSGEFKVYYTPGTPASWSDPGDPDDWEGLPDKDFALEVVRYLLETYPGDVTFKSGDSIKDPEFLKNSVYSVDGGVPSDDEVYSKLEDEQVADLSSYEDMLYDRYKDSRFESIMSSVLAGKSLTEAINERAGDWDIESQEIYGDSSEIIKQEYETELDDWKKDASIKLAKLSNAVEDVKKVLQKAVNSYDIDVKTALGYPFKAEISTMDKSVDYWIKQVRELIDNGGN